MMGGGFFVGMIFLFFLFLLIVGIVAAGIWIFQQNTGPSAGRTPQNPKSSQDEALDILRRRYASGEITREEYEEMKRHLS